MLTFKAEMPESPLQCPVRLVLRDRVSNASADEIALRCQNPSGHQGDHFFMYESEDTYAVVYWHAR